MLSLLIASLLVTGGFEAGGGVGVVFPASGLESNHSDAALFGVNLGYKTGPSRFMLDYGYAGLHAKQASPYRLDINELSVGYGHEFIVGRPATTSDWGFEASAAAGVAPDWYVFRDRSQDRVLPWDIIGGGVKPEFLRREFDRGLREELTWRASGQAG